MDNSIPSSPPAQSHPRLALIVTGDRHATAFDWSDAIDSVLFEYTLPRSTQLLIHGDAPGIDRLAGDRAPAFGFTPIPIPAQWTKYGNPAGPRRNSALVQLGTIYREHGYAVVVLAFHNSLQTSRGTRNMVRQSRDAGLHVRVFTTEGEVS